MKVLVLGSGGREHAIVWALQRTSRQPLQLYCAPGNAGIAEIARCVPIATSSHSSLTHFVRAEGIDLTIVGPEAPLANGIVDEFVRQRLAIVGPTQAASRLESSKAFAKDFMTRHQIPTANYRVVTTQVEAKEVLHSGLFGPPESPVVIKADGLAAGKGVIVASSMADGETASGLLMNSNTLGPDATRCILIEEALQGREASVLVFSDGHDYAVMPAARDHKRIGENDTGPNTGGMGAFTDPSILDTDTLDRVVREIVEPTVAGARQEGFPFQGVLFFGLMLTAKGPKLLEYNVRFGDPETQAILVRLKTDLLAIFEGIRTGGLREVRVEWSNESSVCVVLASGGYPGTYQTGVRISGVDNISSYPNVTVFHAGTARSAEGELVTDGGRVLGITSTGSTLAVALDTCYEALQKISWNGMQYRRDIGRMNDLGRWFTAG